MMLGFSVKKWDLKVGGLIPVYIRLCHLHIFFIFLALSLPLDAIAESMYFGVPENPARSGLSESVLKEAEYYKEQTIEQKKITSVIKLTKIKSTGDDLVNVKKVIALQKWRRTRTIRIYGDYGRYGSVRLINLNPKINTWFILRIIWPHNQEVEYFHLENISPDTQKIKLSVHFRNGLLLYRKGKQHKCPLWSETDEYSIKMASLVKKPYVEVCDNQLLVRNKIKGYRTTKEWIVEFLRSKVWGGEEITTFVKETIFKDKFLIKAKSIMVDALADAEQPTLNENNQQPIGASIDSLASSLFLEPKELGVPVKKLTEGKMKTGRWYESEKNKGVYVSIIQPSHIEKSILESHKPKVADLDPIEKQAQIYLIGFDTDKFEFRYSLGTDHPKVGWSNRVRLEDRKANTTGPEGFDSTSPVISTGLVTPQASKRLIATFTGGFKRSHGAFKWGRLAKVNSGTHYGFIENGVVLSRLQPGLATIYRNHNGNLQMKTWTKSDNRLLKGMQFARQNGVPIIEMDSKTGLPVPGRYVSNWMLGNWSGSQDLKFRTLRAGICMQKGKSKNYLIYAYFSSATPTAMARVFQSYRCNYAMHLDMNALEHTYLALYGEKKGPNYFPDHLIKGMRILDERFKGVVPRFIGYPDNRDFFYVMRKK